jgi:apolipoprotein D and lipocalin family protein
MPLNVSAKCALFILMPLLHGCQGTGAMDPITTVEKLDIERFMGDWYVLADIATPFDKDAYAPTEHYVLKSDGMVVTTYRYQKGNATGDFKSRTMTARPNPELPSIWGMRLIWPFEADYRIAHIHPDYETTIVARNKRDFVWLMARTPTIDQSAFDTLLEKVQSLGYGISDLRFHYGMRPTASQPQSDSGPSGEQSDEKQQSTPRFGT